MNQKKTNQRRRTNTPEYARETRVLDAKANQLLPQYASRMGPADAMPSDRSVFFKFVEEDDNTVEMTKSMVILGRVEGVADISVDDEAASRYHACVVFRKNEFVLADMESTNGTFLNGDRVTEAVLKNHDQIQIGNTVLEFVLS